MRLFFIFIPAFLPYVAVERRPVSINFCPIALNATLICLNSGFCRVINFPNFPFVIPLLHATSAVSVVPSCIISNVTSVSCLLPPTKLFNLRQRHTKVKLLKPTGYVMHQQFNIQQLYVLPTMYLCVLCLSENKQRLVPLTA